MINVTIIQGRLTADPTVRKVGEKSVTAFSIANNQTWKDAQGQRAERADFVDVEAWDGLGSTCAEHLTKGRMVLVEATLRQDRWEDKEGGKHSRHFLRADRVEFLDAPKTEEAAKAAAA